MAERELLEDIQVEQVDVEEYGDVQEVHEDEVTFSKYIPDMRMDDKELSEGQQEELLAQVKAEYSLAYDHLQGKLAKATERLRLYNNQKRDLSAVGDPLLFTLHQTLLASLYDDRMTASWTGREEGDDEQAENLQIVSEYDYDLMDKDMLDYFWNWNTLFFGRACILHTGYDVDGMHPTWENLDPLTLLRDPSATTVNTYANATPARFLGFETELTMLELENERENYMNFDEFLKSPGNTGEDSKSLFRDAVDARNEAQGRSDIYEPDTEELGDNAKKMVLKWMTHYQGKKCIVTTTNDKNKIVRYQVLRGDMFPIVDKACYPSPNDWDGTSVPDLAEDKQRASAILLNLGIEIARAQAYPQYVYDENRIKNPADLQMQKNRAVPSTGAPSGAVMVMDKASIDLNLFKYIKTEIVGGAEAALATPEIQQGSLSKDKRTLGELNLIASGVDTRYSLMAKMFAIAERAYWRIWYASTKSYMQDDFDEKVVRVVGELGAPVRKFRRENLISIIDPDVQIETKTLNEASRIKALNNFSPFFQVLVQDPEANSRYLKKKMGKLLGFNTDEIESMLPPTVEEMRAEVENTLLEDGKLPQIKYTDDHWTHILIHNKASDSNAKHAHLISHRRAMQDIRENPEAFNQPDPLLGAAEGAEAEQQTQGLPQGNRNNSQQAAGEAAINANDQKDAQITQEVISQL